MNMILPEEVSIDLIDPDPKQPRRKFEGLQELSVIIKAVGILQPLAIRPHPSESGRWMIVIGERRWRAAKLAGLETVPVFNRGAIDDSKVFFMQIVENLEDYRHPLEALEKAAALRQWVTEVTVEEACKVLGRKKDWISRETALADVSAEVWDVASTEKIQDKRTILELHRLCKHTGKAASEEWQGLKQIGPKSREALHSRMVASGAKKQRVKKEEGAEGESHDAASQNDNAANALGGATPMLIAPQGRLDAPPSVPTTLNISSASPPLPKPGRFKRKGLDKKAKFVAEKLGIDVEGDFEAFFEKVLLLAVPEVAEIERDEAVPA